ncbi:hypothetical protein [Pseudomonas fluorescens]|jgi:hypothetical protein|uniref:hypothetical protein n=1 Tax=Pseudomonas fluorescens TaxID=294 RepID=UPI0020C4C8EB|nr:hypothetical protein [Pseudomonas fluorescens]UTL88784.1 hypothetical protein NLL86_14935 [Pseudomonas fluorescens]
MNAITQQITQEQRRLTAVNHWFLLYDDQECRRQCPSSHHEELLRQADEMDRLGLIDWREWRDLRRLADRAFLKAIAGADYQYGEIKRSPTVGVAEEDSD